MLTHNTGSSILDCYEILHWLSGTFKPRSYLEIGVREGASLCCVLAEEKEIVNLVKSTIVEGKVQLDSGLIDRIGEAYTPRDIDDIYLFDNWCFIGGEGGHSRIEDLLVKGFDCINYHIFDGDSKDTVPTFFETHKDKIDLVYVDGDHSPEGAITDLENVYGHFKILVCHDLVHPDHPYLLDIWKTYTRKHDLPNFTVGLQFLGVGVAFDLR